MAALTATRPWRLRLISAGVPASTARARRSGQVRTKNRRASATGWFIESSLVSGARRAKEGAVYTLADAPTSRSHRRHRHRRNRARRSSRPRRVHGDRRLGRHEHAARRDPDRIAAPWRRCEGRPARRGERGRRAARALRAEPGDPAHSEVSITAARAVLQGRRGALEQLLRIEPADLGAAPTGRAEYHSGG